MDVTELHRFYATRLGATARRLIAARLRALPEPPPDGRVLGMGFATPWLDRYRARSRDTFAFMPAHQGVIHWPRNGSAACALVDETALPLADGSIDMALVIHGLELTNHLPAMLGELWRVLAPQGRAVICVPNRRGVWARMDTTPFGHGRPFSRRQLEALLAEHHFLPSAFQPALFAPPVSRHVIMRSAPAWERVGMSLWPGFSGVLIIEAIKQVRAVSGERVRNGTFAPLKPAAAANPAMLGSGLNECMDASAE